MVRRKHVLEELNYLTELISKRVRELSARVLAFCWLFIFEKSGLIPTSSLLAPASLAIHALTADLAQSTGSATSPR